MREDFSCRFVDMTVQQEPLRAAVILDPEFWPLRGSQQVSQAFSNRTLSQPKTTLVSCVFGCVPRLSCHVSSVFVCDTESRLPAAPGGSC